MDFFKKPIMCVPTWTFLCGFAAAVLQLLILPQLFGSAIAAHVDAYSALFNVLAVVLFFVVGLRVMRRYPRKTILFSAAIHLAISLVIAIAEQLTQASPLLVFLFLLYPFLYFSSALASIVLSLLPAASATAAKSASSERSGLASAVSTAAANVLAKSIFLASPYEKRRIPYAAFSGVQRRLRI